MITDRLAELVSSALTRAEAEGVVARDGLPPITFDRPKRREHGDWATNIALAAAKGGRDPRALARAIVERLPASPLVDRVEVAGPGFLNFHLSPRWLHEVVRAAADISSGFGRTQEGIGTKVNVEFVSSNPTGPVNVVSGRHAAVGDALANLLEATGHSVTREFYVNDQGRQIDLFARSVAARYLQHYGIEADVPDEGYQGDYVVEVAHAIAGEVGDVYVTVEEAERLEAMRRLGLEMMLEATRRSLQRFGTTFDVWFRESKLHDSGSLDDALEKLRARGLLEEREGALWFLSSKLGDDKDRVVRRSDGRPTYRTGDLAYLLDKFGRGFDRLIYLWGADHHGTVPSLLAGVEALGFDREAVEVPIIQNIALLEGGGTIKASKRAGIVVPLDELVEEVGADATRYTFLTRSIDSPLDFDIALVKEQAPENPVYYVQYAHARICSILRNASVEGVASDIDAAPLDRLVHPSEDVLMRKLASFEEVVPDAARMRAPQRIPRYVEELASDFSAFYRDCRVLSDDRELSLARLALCVATKQVIAAALELLGVRAPERM